ncbi:MAG: PaaI family thioesterase [Sandaracinaceae bacterium]
MDDPLDGSLFGPGQPCFGCAPDHPHGLRLRFERAGDEVRTRYLPHDAVQGPPGLMHGGLVTTLADELAAWAVIALRGKFGFTGSLSGTFHAPVRLGTEVLGTARILRDRRRLIDVEVELRQSEDTVFRGEFRFVVPDRKGAERLLGSVLPEAWERFSR